MNVIIFGAGKQAELTYFYFTHDSRHTVAAFCVESTYFDPDHPTLFGLPVLQFDEDTPNYPPSDYRFHIAMGDNRGREAIFKRLKQLGYSFVNYVSSSAGTWQDLELGENVFIGQGTSIQPFVKIGSNSIIMGSLIGHHTSIGNNVLISGASIGGSATIGDNTFIGLNSAITEHVRVGRNNLIGSGCVISKDTADDSVYSSDATRKRKVSASRFRLFKNRD